jgi:hypothetical protein
VAVAVAVAVAVLFIGSLNMVSQTVSQMDSE